MIEFDVNTLILLLTLAFIIISSPFFAKILKLPVIATEIILGCVAGFMGFIGDNALLKLVANVGFYYLMFLAGMQIDLNIFLKAGKSMLKRCALYLGLLYAFSIIATILLNKSTIFVVIFPIMSVGLLSSLYKDYGKEQIWLNLAMLTGLIGEIISIALITFVSAYFEFGFGWQLCANLAYLALFFIFSIAFYKFTDTLFWWFPSIKIILMPQNDTQEQDIRLCMAMFFSIIALMLWLGLEIAFGAFVMGIFIATFFNHKQNLTNKLSSLGYGFLVPIFFAYIGSTFKLSAIFEPGVFSLAVMIVLLLILLRILSSYVLFKPLGVKNSILVAFSHSMPLTLLVAVATIAIKASYITKEQYSSFILASLLGAICVTIIIKIAIGEKKDKFSKI